MSVLLLSGAAALGDVNCAGEFVFPADCDPSLGECDYVASYEMVEKNLLWVFVKEKVKGQRWMGIGWSPKSDGAMQDGEAIIYVDHHIKEFLLAGHDTPLIADGRSSLQNMNVSDIEGFKHFDGYRPLKPDEAESPNRMDLGTTCVHFIFPQNGGPAANRANIERHTETPKVGVDLICFNECLKFGNRGSFNTSTILATLATTTNSSQGHNHNHDQPKGASPPQSGIPLAITLFGCALYLLRP